MEMLPRYRSMGQAYWRALELAALEVVTPDARLQGRVLELGPGDAGFSSLAIGGAGIAVDMNLRALRRDRARGSSRAQVAANICALPLRGGSADGVFANSVIEHVDGCDAALEEIARVLRPGGRFLCTVPLAHMNEWLLSTNPYYTRWRQSGLQHHNLVDPSEWHRRFATSGLRVLLSGGYLTGPECRLWDRLDAWGMLGWGRLRASRALGLPLAHSSIVAGAIARKVTEWHAALPQEDGRCAAVFLLEQVV